MTRLGENTGGTHPVILSYRLISCIHNLVAIFQNSMPIPKEYVNSKEYPIPNLGSGHCPDRRNDAE